MSPAQMDLWTSATRGPRASGDEPVTADSLFSSEEWSPRERG